MGPNLAWALTLAALLAGLTGCQREVKPTAQDQAVIEALSKREGTPVEIVEVTHERRNGHAVSCGFYRHRSHTPDPPGAVITAAGFAWMDGRVVKTGPEWNEGTLCLIEHYNGPLP